MPRPHVCPSCLGSGSGDCEGIWCEECAGAGLLLSGQPYRRPVATPPAAAPFAPELVAAWARTRLHEAANYGPTVDLGDE